MFWVDVSVKMKHSLLFPASCFLSLVSRPNAVRRSARIFIWRSLSSPDMYSTFKLGMLNASCSIRVDFPIPGSPPMSTSEPATMPPPNTRLNSASGVNILSSSLKVISETGVGLLERCSEVDGAFQSGMELLAFSMISSANVFHCWHDGHLPSHLGDSKPQLWQKYAILVLAILLDVQICPDSYRDTNVQI